ISTRSTPPCRRPVWRSCWDRPTSSTATGSSCSSTPTAMSGRSRRRSNRSALKRWPRSWPGVDAPVSERALRAAAGPRERHAEPDAAADGGRCCAVSLGGARRQETAMSFYRDHIYPHLVSMLGNPKPIREVRRRIVPLAQGTVLEIGVGPGVNLVHYD